MITEKIKILHLEDSETDVEHIQRVLSRAGIPCSTRVVDTRAEYIEALRDFDPQVVLSDHSMPAFNSLEALDILRTSGIDIPFILLTGAVSEEFAADVMLRGADDYILKDRPKRLPAAILGAIEKYKHRRERERQQAELRNIFDGSMDVLCSIDSEGRFINASAAAEKTWGYKASELAGKKYVELVYEADHAATRQIAYDIMSGLTVTNFENRYVHKNGHLVPMIWSARWDAEQRVMYAIARDGTEKVKAEKALLNERKRLMDLFADAPVNMCMFRGHDHVFEMVNRVSQRQINQDVIGKKYKDIFPEFQDQGFTKLMDKVYETGEPFEAKEMLVKVDQNRDGTLVDNYLNILLQPYSDSEGHVAGICYFGVHVTEQVLARKKIEESFKMLKSAESLQSSILNSLPAQIALVNSKGDIIAVNQSWKNFSKENNMRSPNYGLGQNYITTSYHAKHDDDIIGRKMANGIRDVIHGNKKIFSIEYRCDSSTERRWILARVAPTTYGNERGAVIVHSNITDQKLAEEKIRESEAKLEAMIENADAHIYSLDRQLRYIAFNSTLKYSMMDNYGIKIKPGDNVCGFLGKIDPAESEWWEKVYNEALTGKTMRFVKDYSIPGIPYYLNFSITPILRDGTIIGLSCFARDITEMKQAENEIKELNENLEKRIADRTAQLEQSMKELESFSYSVSHDLRAPLRVINGFANLFIEDYKGKVDDEAIEYIKTINANAIQMGQLIEDLLNLSRLGLEALEKTNVDMGKIVEAIMYEYKLNHDGSIPDISVDTLLPAECSRNLLKQVWVNLITNAIKYSSKKTNPKIHISSYMTEKDNVYVIKDNGAGFDMKYASRLFGVFQRLHSKQDFEGTGVGLALVHRIITRHGGKVWAEGKPDEGATFYFSLPR